VLSSGVLKLCDVMHKPGELYAEDSEKAGHYKRLQIGGVAGGMGAGSVPIPPDAAPVSEGLIRYEEIKFGKELGEGGFGVVYQAVWKHDVVAVKRIKDKLLRKNAEAAKVEFIKELELLRSLTNRHVVRFCQAKTLRNTRPPLVLLSLSPPDAPPALSSSGSLSDGAGAVLWRSRVRKPLLHRH